MDFNFFGIGLPEIIVIFLLMLVFMGPKRMMVLAYQIGIYVQKIRRVVDETMGAVRKEFEAANLDLPKDLNSLKPPTLGNAGRFDIVQEANRFLNSDGSAPSESAPTNASPTTPTVSEPSPEQKPGDEKPRYDSWLPKN